MLMIGSGLSPADFEDYPGAPFTQAAIDAAVLSIRHECGWHLAPLTLETREFSTRGADALILPSLRVEEVTSVEHVPFRGESPLGAISYDFKADEGVLWRFGGWPLFVRVSFRHGFAQWPADLLALIADRARALAVGGKVRQESLLGRSVSLDFGALAAATSPTIQAYRIGWPSC